MNKTRNNTNAVETVICALVLVFAATIRVQARIKPAGLPQGARIIESQSLARSCHPNRSLMLWMLRPARNPRPDPDDVYTCPEETRGSCYSGPTRVSLVNLKTNRIINTVRVRDVYLANADTYDRPYRIHAGSYYHVPGVQNGSEGKPKLIWLRDYNGDGKALEFALYNALACMGLQTCLIGYSERQDRVIEYHIHLKIRGEDGRTYRDRPWCDYIFSIEPCSPGHWRFEIDYRGRGGSLDRY